jgi:predicted component of type VI protein secretion system
VNAYAEWAGSHRNMFGPLQQLVRSRAFGAATGKAMGMIVAVEDGPASLQYRAEKLCRAVWSVGVPAGSRVEADHALAGAYRACLAELVGEMGDAREAITRMIGPHLQHAAEMAIARAEALPGRRHFDGTVGMGPYEVPGMAGLVQLLLKARREKLGLQAVEARGNREL